MSWSVSKSLGYHYRLLYYWCSFINKSNDCYDSNTGCPVQYMIEHGMVTVRSRYSDCYHQTAERQVFLKHLQVVTLVYRLLRLYYWDTTELLWVSC